MTSDLDHPETAFVREVRSGDSYNSQSEIIAHFGMADYADVDLVSITWPSGTIQSLRGIATNQTLTIVELPEPNGWWLTVIPFAVILSLRRRTRPAISR